MSDVQTLLAKCRDLGATFSPTPEGKLKVQAPAPLPDALRQELKQRKAEILAALQSPSCACPQCGGAIMTEEVTPSLDGHRSLLWWRCNGCRIWGVKTERASQPVAWVTTTVQ